MSDWKRDDYLMKICLKNVISFKPHIFQVTSKASKFNIHRSIFFQKRLCTLLFAWVVILREYRRFVTLQKRLVILL